MSACTALGPLALLAASVGATAAIQVPGGKGGVGFDDLVYSRELRRVLVPAGRTGRLDLVDPQSGALEVVGGFSASGWTRPGHGQGTTSADAGGGWVFAVDRNRRELDAVDPRARRIVARVALGAGPDYVRWVEAAHQVWVTEPDRERIEVFQVGPGSPPELASVGSIPVPGGPESLVVDPAAGRAYTNTFEDATVAVEVSSRAVVARWTNHCRGARGVALGAAGEVVLVGCAEGKVVALGTQDGAVLGEAQAGRGVDSIAFSPELSHVYAPAAGPATLTIVGVSGHGVLEALGSMPAAPGAHCAAADDRGDVFVCDPGQGRVLVLHDPYPASR